MNFWWRRMGRTRSTAAVGRSLLVEATELSTLASRRLGATIHRRICFVRAESTESYVHLFKSVRDSIHKFFDIELGVKYGSLDHADTILNALRQV